MQDCKFISFSVTPNDSLVRRSISQQKSGVSITIDDPIRPSRELSPPRGKTSNIIHVCNLVCTFTNIAHFVASYLTNNLFAVFYQYEFGFGSLTANGFDTYICARA